MGFTKPGFAQKLTLPSLCHQLQDCAIGTPHKQCAASLPPARQGQVQVQQGLFYRTQASLGNTSQDMRVALLYLGLLQVQHHA